MPDLESKGADLAYLRKAIQLYFEEHGFDDDDLEYWLRVKRDHYDNQKAV